MSSKFKFRFFEYPVFYGVIVFLILFITTQYITYERYQLLKKTDEQETISRANWIEKEIQQVLNQSFSTTQTLAFIIENYGVPKNFDSIAQLLLQTNKNIDALELVDSLGVITHVYPLEENSIVGFNILKDTIGKKGALITMQRKEYFVTGPIRLKQGGDGLVSRIPIFKGDTFEGFSAAVIKLPNLLKAIDVSNKPENRFLYQLAKVNYDNSEEIFLAANSTSNNEAYTKTIGMTQGEWKLSIFSNKNKLLEVPSIFSVLGLLLSFIGGIFVWHLLRQPSKLKKLVAQKTLLLSANEEKFRELFEQASDGIFVSDLNEKFIDVNIVGCEMLGYSKKEILEMKVSDIILYDTPSRHSEILIGKTVFHERKILHKNGTTIFVEINVKKQKNNSIQAIVRNIDDRKKLEAEANSATEKIKESEAKYRLLIENATDGIFLLDENLTFLEVNAHFCTMFGVQKDYFVGRHITEGIDPENLKANPLKLKELKEGKTVRSLRKLQRKDKSNFYAESSVKMLPNNLYQGILHDVTESIKANELLKKSELKYRELTERISDAFIAVDSDWNYTYISTNAGMIFQKDPSLLIGKNVWEEFPEFNNSNISLPLREAMKTQKFGREQQYSFVLKKWFDYRIYPSPNGLSVYFSDITEMKLAEEKIKDAQEKMDAAIRIGKIGYWSWDIEKDEVDWSDRMYAIYDVDLKTSLKYDTVLNCIHPDDQQMHQDIVAQRIKNKNNSSFSYRIVHKDKSIHYVMVQLEVITNENKEVIKFQGNVIDITERVNAQNELKESQEKFYKSFHSNLTGKVIVDEQRTILEANETIAALLETSRENLIGKKLIDANVLDRAIHEKSEKRQLLWNKLIEHGVLRDEEFTYTLKSGKKIPALLSIEPLELENKTHFLVSAIDNSKRKEAEENLLKSEERFRKLTSNAPVGIFQTDASGMCTYVNEEWLKFSGVKFDDALGFGWVNAIYSDDKEKVMLEWQKALEQEKPHKTTFRYHHKKGKILTLAVKATPFYAKDDSVLGYIGSAVDITNSIEVEKKLAAQNAELLKTNAELDRFVYSASHELRAPLASVLGLINIILSEEKEPDLVFKLDMMEQSLKRLDSFIKDIVQYSQNKHIEVISEKIDFHNLVQNSLESLWYLKNRSSINIQVKINNDVEFYSDKKRISIILNNLISNAIKYHNIEGSNPTITITITTNLDKTNIKIKDNGIGIPQDHLQNIFKMFYRVSSKVMGTGIGLFVVKEIIEKIGGEITVESEENKGTTFKVVLPNQKSNKYETKKYLIN